MNTSVDDNLYASAIESPSPARRSSADLVAITKEQHELWPKYNRYVASALKAVLKPQRSMMTYTSVIRKREVENEEPEKEENVNEGVKLGEYGSHACTGLHLCAGPSSSYLGL